MVVVKARKREEVQIELIILNLSILNKLIVDGRHFHFPNHDHSSDEFHSLYESYEYHDLFCLSLRQNPRLQLLETDPSGFA